MKSSYENGRVVIDMRDTMLLSRADIGGGDAPVTIKNGYVCGFNRGRLAVSLEALKWIWCPALLRGPQ